MSLVGRVAALIAVVLWADWAQATVYYAGPVEQCGGGYSQICGNDGYDGSALTGTDNTGAGPKTLKTLLGSVTAGDTIILGCGVYYDATATEGNPVYNPTNSGTSGNPITIQSVTRQCAKFIPYERNDKLYVWSIEGKNYITVDGIFSEGKFRVNNTNTGIVVKNSEFTHGGWDGSSLITALQIGGCTNCTIQDNFCHTMRGYPHPEHILGSHNNACIMSFSGNTGTIFEHNAVDGGGPLVKDSSQSLRGSTSWAGIGEKGGNITSTTYRRNWIVGTNFCFMGMASTTGALRAGGQRIYENICTDTIFGGVDPDHSTYDYWYYNNTFYNLGTGGSTRAFISFGNFDSAMIDSGDNRDYKVYNNIVHTVPVVYRKEPSFLPSYNVSCRVTNLLAPWPTLTAGTSGSLATGTYWVRIATDNSGTITGTGPAQSVSVTGPSGSIAVGWDRTAGSPTNYRVYYGTTDYSQTSYDVVAASGSAGDAQSHTITGVGSSTLAYSKSSVNQWQWVYNLAESNYNNVYNVTGAFAKYNSGSTSYAASLANWQTNTATIGNGGTCISGYDLNSISTDPGFDTAIRDFRLPASSGARNAASGGGHMGAYISDSDGEKGPRNGYWVIRRSPTRTVTAATTIVPKN